MRAEHIYVVLADDSSKPPLSEGIVGMVFPQSYQLVTLHEAMLPGFRQVVQPLAASGRTVRLVKFTRAEVLEEWPGGGS